ncbi:helix-turn-helix transcriptional regulator [Hyphobacterium sp.]|jgi:predicted DNA-binding transcriptional regulator YafY|uniref:helix-turn-helix transcriptional regulator n=1 Tax=Hyphobacterium sp. TaxID=2004662 RepID=UPI003BA8DB98
MSRARRLVDIVRTLKAAAPGSLTAQQIADRFSVSERTIYRDMAKLIDSGVPIEGEAGLGYWLAPDDGPPPISLTWRQAQILWRGARLIALTADEEAAGDAVHAQDALAKMLGDQRVRRLESHPLLSLTDKLRPAAPVLAAFERAIANRFKVRIVYVDLDEADQEVEGLAVSMTPIGEMRVLTLSVDDNLVHLRAERIRRIKLRA